MQVSKKTLSQNAHRVLISNFLVAAFCATIRPNLTAAVSREGINDQRTWSRVLTVHKIMRQQHISDLMEVHAHACSQLQRGGEARSSDRIGACNQCRAKSSDADRRRPVAAIAAGARL